MANHKHLLAAALKARMPPEQLAELTDLESAREQANLLLENAYLNTLERLRTLFLADELTIEEHARARARVTDTYHRLRFDKEAEK